MNNYHEPVQLDEVQRNRLTDASLAGQDQRGDPQNSLLFDAVHNDCSASSQPAACAISAHMDSRQSINEREEQLTARYAGGRPSTNRARGTAILPPDPTGVPRASRAVTEPQEAENHQQAQGYLRLLRVNGIFDPPSPDFRGGEGVRARVGKKEPIFAGDLK